MRGMSKRSFDDDTLARVRNMSLLQVLDFLQNTGKLVWRCDPDFRPAKDQQTVRLYISAPTGYVFEILITGSKWFDSRDKKGGGGGVDLVMHLQGVDFVPAVKLLSSYAARRPGVLSQ